MSELKSQNSAQLLRTEFSLVEQLCEAVRFWDLDFQPLGANSHRDRVGSFSQQRLGAYDVMHAGISTSIEQKVAAPANTISFAVLGAGVRRLWWRGGDDDSGAILVYRGGEEVRALTGPDFEVFTVTLSEDRLERLCEKFGLALPAFPLRPESFRPRLAVMQTLRLHIARLTASANDEAALLAKQVVELLVINWLDETCEQVRRPSMRSRDRAMRLCLERVEQKDWINLSPELLCETAGVSERTLQYAFRERFGLTPAAFLKARRLASTHRLLRQAKPAEQSVGDVAASLGFSHLSHFAEDYRRAFGELPSETMKRVARD